MITAYAMGRCHATGLPAETQPTEIHNGYGPVPGGSDGAVFRPQEPSRTSTILPQADPGVRGSPSILGPNAGQQGDSSPRVGGLFAGAGALDLAVHHTLDAQPAWFVENDPVASRVLAHHWPDVPNHGDITRVNWADVEPVDVLCGGFPCTDVSSAGKRAGLRPGTRSGLWSHMAYAISQLKPKLVVIENVRGLLSADAHCELEPCPWCLGDNKGRPLRALGCVLGDLAQLGYDARWCGLRASSVGAPHPRFRVFISAWPARAGESERPERERVRNSARYRGSTVTDPNSIGQIRPGGTWGRWPGSPDGSQSPSRPRRPGMGTCHRGPCPRKRRDCATPRGNGTWTTRSRSCRHQQRGTQAEEPVTGISQVARCRKRCTACYRPRGCQRTGPLGEQ